MAKIKTTTEATGIWRAQLTWLARRGRRSATMQEKATIRAGERTPAGKRLWPAQQRSMRRPIRPVPARRLPPQRLLRTLTRELATQPEIQKPPMGMQRLSQPGHLRVTTMPPLADQLP